MSIKIIATDLDGTLMSPDHITVTERTKNALFKAHEKGIKIAVATGRTLGFITPVTDQIPFVDYAVFSNGASVYDMRKKEIIIKNHIPAETTELLLKKLENTNVYYNVYTDGKVYTQKDKQQYYTSCDLPEEFLKLFAASTTVCENLCEELTGKSTEIIAVYSTDEAMLRSTEEYFNSLGLLVTASLKDEIEVTAPSANKGTALSEICEVLGIDRQEAMAFGDAMNDEQMIEFAGYSFAMGNACDELKKKASYTTLSNAEDGLASAVEKYAL